MKPMLLLAAVRGPVARGCRDRAGGNRRRRQARSRKGADDREPGLRRLPRRGRQQPDGRKSEPGGAAGRIHRPAARALQGRHPHEPVMQGMAATLNPDDMKALGVYFSQQKPKLSAAKDAELARPGKSSTAAVTRRPASRHAPLPFAGRRGHSEELSAPGRPVGRLYPRAAQGVQVGDRGADKDGKDANGKMMAAIAFKMTDEQMKAVAEYLAGLRCSGAPVSLHEDGLDRRAQRLPGQELRRHATRAGTCCSPWARPEGGCQRRQRSRMDDRRTRGRFVTQRELPRLALVRRRASTTARCVAPSGRTRVRRFAGGTRRTSREVVVWRARSARTTRAMRRPRGSPRASSPACVSCASTLPRSGAAIPITPATPARTRRSPMDIRCWSSGKRRSTT